MPPQTNSNSQAQRSTTFKSALYLVLLIAILLAITGGYWWWQLQRDTLNVTLKLSVNEMLHGNDLEKAYEDGQAVINSPLSSADQKALAELAMANVPFRMTGDPQFLLTHIPIYKKIIEDKQVSLPIRISAINALASAYCASGRTWAVFQEIYKDEPYSTFLVSNDPDASGRNMFEWSYGQYPTSDAAIAIARSYAGQAKADEFMKASSSTIRADLQKAKEYLASAEELSQKELSIASFEYQRGMRHAVYLYWHAYTVALLAHYEGGAYTAQYKKEYEDFIESYKGDGMIQYFYVPYAQMLYGFFLSWNNEGQRKKAISLYEAAVESAKSDPYYDTDQFVRFIHNEKELRKVGIMQGVFSTAVGRGKLMSPKFKEFVDSIK